MLVNSKELLKKIKKNRALCAFNFSTVEVAEAIVKTASRLKTPVILQTSQGETSFVNPEVAQGLAAFLSEKYQLPLSLNLDHGQEMKLIKKCLSAGYSSVHFDGSALPLEENIAQTRRVARLCRKKKVSVEGEVGQIDGRLTEPGQALRLIEETKVDFLAVAIGEKHGLKKVKLDFDLLKKIVRLMKVPLVLHGGSGIPKDDLKKAIRLGIRKINFNTELRMAWSQTLRKTLKNKPEEIVPYKILPASQKAVSQIVEEKIKVCSA